MDRRSFFKSASTFLVSVWIPKSVFAFNSKNFGWLPNSQNLYKSLYDSGNLENFGQNKVACLWKAYEEVRKQVWNPRDQVWGDCVAQASGAGLDISTCCRIAIEHKREKYVNDSSTDMIYAGGRNLVGKRSTGQGMQGIWAMTYLNKWGNLLKQVYGEYDLRPYNIETVRYWDKHGVPEELLQLAKKNPLLKYVQVKSWEEVRDAVAGGKPVVLCTDTFGANNDLRDEDGFIRPSGSWAHAWLVGGVQDGVRPGACLLNSHGSSFGRGPKTYGQPDGSVWIDAKYIDRAVSKYKDSYAISDYKGFDAPEERYIIW
jgi:hypothetical protein